MPAGPSNAKPSQPLAPWSSGRSLGAALWPTSCALAFAAYAFFPERFPEQTSLTLWLLVAAEIPLIVLGLLHAVALSESTVKGRLVWFFGGLLVLALVVGLNFGFKTDLRALAPTLAWVLVPYVIDLSSTHPDPALASQQAEAVVSDKMHLLALTPSLAIAGVLLGITTVALLAGISIASGEDLIGRLSDALGRADPSLFALIGSAYLLVCAASAAHVHRPVFLRDRKRLLDRPWLVKLTIRSKDRKAAR